RSIVHGTMLYNTDLEVMVRSITPDNEKLVSKGIDSVRSRVTNIHDHLDITLEEFKAHFRKNLCDSQITLKESDIASIREIEKTYLKEDFIYGKNPNYTLKKKGRAQAGMIEVTLELKNNLVKNIQMLGDYFLIEDEDEFLNLFKQIEFSRNAFDKVLEKHPISDYIYNLQKDEFLDILFD
ncbi:MAG TPA: lipoate protein ligase C-terminal domain-containing protein, partial [Bacillota bacterium]|nr:lipoate protein ligase C-terminal domain-containing protein [Bacillota bacterium]